MGITEAARPIAEALKQACSVPRGDSREDAVRLAEDVAQYLPDATLATRVGFVLQLEGELQIAVAAYRRAIALDSTRFDAWYALGCAELGRGSESEAIRCFRRALTLRPTHPRAHLDLGRALFGVGEIEAALDNLRIAAHCSELHQLALALIARCIPGSPRADNAAVLAARRASAALESITDEPLVPRHHTASSAHKLRVGYVSAFFGHANWLKPVWGVINHHDRGLFEIHLVSDGEPPTKECGYSQHRHDQYVDAKGLSNMELAAKVVELGIDVLVDLNGYSFQRRLGLFMLRPAPLIIGWFNMFATTGIEAFNYIVGDDTVIPHEEERFYCERVARVPGSYLAFSVLYPVPEIVPPPCVATGQLTFGSFASQYKLTDEVITAWATILKRAPDSRLLLKNRALGDASNRAALHERFRCRGILTERVLLEGPEPHYKFLDAYGRVDIALDTFPYSGGTTTTEALWAGVPVLTFNGDRWASRTSRSLLLAAGLDAWCMPNLTAYIDRAVMLAGSPMTAVELRKLRMNMRERLKATSACDSAGLCRALENLYRQGFQDKCS
jgi:predicted O-linked N-acetylglucosamine transferase (SPINDLY family)